MNTSNMPAAQSSASSIVSGKKKKGDVGKKNNGTTTGFSAVANSAKKQGYSANVAQKIAGAQYQKMKSKGQL